MHTIRESILSREQGIYNNTEPWSWFPDTASDLLNDIEKGGKFLEKIEEMGFTSRLGVSIEDIYHMNRRFGRSKRYSVVHDGKRVTAFAIGDARRVYYTILEKSDGNTEPSFGFTSYGGDAKSFKQYVSWREDFARYFNISSSGKIIESILSKEKGLYSTEKYWKVTEQFVSFLESNGYKKVDTLGSYELLIESKKKGLPVYSLGDYNSEPITHWIKFCDCKKDKGTVFFWRDEETIDKLKSRGSSSKIYAVIKEDSYGSHWTNINDLEEFRNKVRVTLGL